MAQHLFTERGPLISDEYVSLYVNMFAINADSRIIDIGCGQGLMATKLSRFSNHVIGLDKSKPLIDVAQSLDEQKKVKWICKDVEDFDWENYNFTLAFSFEAFHLFPHPKILMRKIFDSVVKGGFIAVGWINYEWEKFLLSKTILNIFKRYDITWDDWGYWSIPNFESLVLSLGISAMPINKISIKVETSSNITFLSKYLSSIDKAGHLNAIEQRELSMQLETSLKEIIQQQVSVGISEYHVVYIQRL